MHELDLYCSRGADYCPYPLCSVDCLIAFACCKKIFQLIVLGSDIDNTCGKYGIDAGHGCINLIENCYEVQLVSFYMCYCLIGKLHKHCCQFNALLLKSN